jgi:uncharacterized protein (DUF1786 family)
MNRDVGHILAIDVGAGTQDILLYDEGQPVENSVKLVLPSWTRVLARSIELATKGGRSVFLDGNLMGGGPCVSAMKRHIRAGYRVYATPRAARTVRDDPDQVREMGVEIVEHRPNGEQLLILRTRDVDLDILRSMLAPLGVGLPDTVAIAVQDHGETLTRMRAVQEDAPGALMMDTGSAAIWGTLQDPEPAAHQGEGLIVVNVGNQHTIGVLLQDARIWGLFEHHTVLMSTEKLAEYVDRLRRGVLPNHEVYADDGHGAVVHPDYLQAASAHGAFQFVAVTGPQRGIAAPLGYYMAAPHGDMMLSGCFGLVAATRALLETGS